jgi:hypothetical protein
VYSTVPSGGGAFGRGPLGPSVTGRPPTRSGLKSMDVARPLTTVGVHAVSNNAAHAIVSANRAFTRLYPLSVPTVCSTLPRPPDSSRKIRRIIPASAGLRAPNTGRGSSARRILRVRR